jgi:hypothetical protein
MRAGRAKRAVYSIVSKKKAASHGSSLFHELSIDLSAYSAAAAVGFTSAV